MAQDDKNTPKPLPLPAGKTLQAYPLKPVDGFVLSRIDGGLSAKDIVTATGLDEASVSASLRKLAELGLISYGDPPPRPQSKPPSQPGKRSPSIPPRSITEVSNVLADGTPRPTPALYDPAELDEDVEMDLEQRRRILDSYYQLGEVDLFTILGVDQRADKKTIKRAYYELAGIFHPDKFFRKRLGSFKSKMEAVFSRITEAHDTLLDKERRAEYETYLGAQRDAKRLEIELRRSSSPGMQRNDPSTTSPPAPPLTIPVTNFPPERTSGVHLSEQARRDALARRLLGGRSTAPPTPIAPPVADPDVLRRHYEQKVNAMRTHVAKEHITNAEQSAARNDWVGATNAYRLAVQVNPDDEDTRRALLDAQLRANAILADAYRKQASYEEKSGHFEEAARSWQRVVKVMPDEPGPCVRAATCLLKVGKDYRNAATLAQKAIAIEPEAARHRVLLAEIYTAAGLTLNARRELEAAARLAPDDANIEALLKKAGKG